MLFILVAVSLQEKPIDFRPEIGTAPAVIAQLAKKSGLVLKAAPNVANDVIAVVAPSKPPREIMDQIAYVLEAEWQEQNGVWLLSRSESKQRAQAQKDKDLTIAEIKAAIAKIPDPQPWGATDAGKLAGQVNALRGQMHNATTFRAIQDGMPEHRLLIKFLKGIPAEDLAIPFATRSVFSSNPNPRQRAIPFNLNDGIREMRSESAALHKSWIEPAEGMPHLFYAPTLHQISKVIVSVTRSPIDGLSVRMMGFNPAQNDVFSAHRILANSLGTIPTPDRIAEDDQEITLRPMSKALLSTALAAMSYQNVSPTGDLKEWLQHPKENEPLALVNTEAMQAIAKAEDKPLAAVIPEAQLYAAATMAPNGKLTIRRYLQSLSATHTVREDRDGWITYRESNPHLGRQHRVNRLALDNYYRRIERDGKTGLDGFAEFVLKHPTPLEFTLYPLHLLVNGSPRENYPYSDDLSIVRFYGTLSQDQKDALRAERELPLSAFSSAQTAILSKMYFNGRHQSYGFDAVDSQTPLVPSPRIWTEPTEAYPNGLRAPFSVSAKIYDAPAIFRKGVSGETMPFSASEIAWEIYQSERPDIFPQTGRRGVQGDYFEGRVVQWPFKFRISPTSVFYTRLTEHSLNPGPPRRLEGMPQAFRDQITEAIERYRREYAHLRPGDGATIRRGAGPPPQSE